MADTLTESTGSGTNKYSGKLKRSYLMHYIDASFGSSTPKWFLIGKDIEDMSMELNPEADAKNIFDQTIDNGYAPSLGVETYYADTNDEIYDKLKDIAMNRLTGESCRTKILEVLIDNTATINSSTGAITGASAWVEDCFVKPQSYGGAGGNNSGVNIPYNVSLEGNRQKGTVAITDKVPTFTAT
ncbi:MAG: hypothetical protein SO152_03640 [Ruminococcus sp.]|nr:hypothetical protein [Ruminococcus sp.]